MVYADKQASLFQGGRGAIILREQDITNKLPNRKQYAPYHPAKLEKHS